MKVCVPEISWHNCEPVYTIHVHPVVGPNGHYYIATGAADRLVRIWRVFFETNQSVANPVQVNFVAEFTVHQASVNAVRFSPNGKYLISGSDDRSLVLWEVGDFEVKSATEGDDDNDARDIWPVKRILRGHLEGVYDLSWSPCSTKVASASVDNSVIVWDVTNGNKLAVLRDARSYVQGVSWDPKNEFIVTLSSDRYARFYSIPKAYQCVARLHQAAPVVGNKTQTTPAPPLFADDMVTRSFFRRAGYSPDGRFVILSGGVVEIPTGAKPNGNAAAADKEKEKDKESSNDKTSSSSTPTPTPTPVNGTSSTPPATVTRHAAHLVVCPASARPGKPIISWPSPRRAIIAAAFCPLTFEPTFSGAKKRDIEGMPVQPPGSKLKIRRRFVAALVAADALILVETSKTCRPIGYIGGLHLDQLTDASWSADGRLLMASSTDGYCTMVTFSQNELGTPMNVQAAIEAQTNQAKVTEPIENSVKSSSIDDAANVKVGDNTSGSGKRRIAPLLVDSKEEVPTDAAPAAAFFGLETSKSSSGSDGIAGGSTSSVTSKMEVDASEPAVTNDAKTQSMTEVPVSVLVPRRRVALMTVSSLPGDIAGSSNGAQS